MTIPGAASPGPDPAAEGPGTAASPGADPASVPPAGASPAGAARPAATPAEGGDWTDQVTELIVETVDKVRARTTGPVLDVAHAAVYGIVAAIVAIPVMVALLAGLVRALDWIVPGDVWVAYLIIAVGMWLLGAILWSRRERADTPTP